MSAGQRRVMERAALGLLGLAILLIVAGVVGTYLKPRSAPPVTSLQPAGTPRPEVPAPAAKSASQSTVAPEADLQPPASATKSVADEKTIPETKAPGVTPPVAAAKPAPAAKEPEAETLPARPSKRTAKPRPTAVEPRASFQLQSGGPVTVLALAEAAAAEMRRDPGSKAMLTQLGLLFSVPNHTAVTVEERHDGLVKVRILNSALEGRVGWVPANQVTAR